MSEYPRRADIEVGAIAAVSVGRGGREETGPIAEILTKGDQHPHGIMVLLEDGTKGRVHELRGKPPAPIGRTETPAIDLAEILKATEGPDLEFKESATWSKDQKLFAAAKKDPRNTNHIEEFASDLSRFAYAKVVVSFLNSYKGGDVLIGIREDKDSNENIAVGIQPDIDQLKDKTTDGFRREILEGLKAFLPSKTYNKLDQFITLETLEHEGAMIARIVVRPSTEPVFLKGRKDPKDRFYIRVDTTSKILVGSELIEYTKDRWN